MRKLVCSLLMLLTMIFSANTLFAQTRTITGKVTTVDAAPLEGVTVSVTGSSRATTTDENGIFSIQARSGEQIEVSYVGYQTASIQVGASNNLAVILSTTQSQMDEVVVVGYGTQRKTNLTGAVSTVDVGKTFQSRPITDVGRGLQGAVPGLTITTPSGDIGTNPSIRLRGLQGSLSNTNGARPLILVDNVELPDLRMINAEDIESMSVLKDAASTSIYGPRAAWGVILITTKKGKRGTEKYSISYSNNFSWSQPTVMPEIAPAVEGAVMAFRALQRTNPNTTIFGAVGTYYDSLGIEKMKAFQAQYGDGSSLGPEMEMGRDFEVRSGRLFFYRPWDVRKLYLRDWTPQQTHNLSFSGSANKTTYNVNFGYLDQTGVLKVNEDKFKRYNLDLGLTSQITNWFNLRGKFMFANAQQLRPYYYSSETYDPWYYLLRWQRTYPYGLYEGKPWRSAITEVEQAKKNDNRNLFTRVSVGGTFNLLKGLTFDADYTYDAINEHEQRTGGGVTAYNFWAGGGTFPYETYTSATYNRAQLYSTWSQRKVFKGFATYNKRIADDHGLKLIVGGDMEDYGYTYQYSERRKLIDPNMGLPNLATGDQFVGSEKSGWATAGIFGRINYDYKNKYLLELNGRYDGSSKFPVNQKWGFFPSMSAGWVISNENFMQAANPLLSFLKLRGSWGVLGNQAIPDFRYISTMRTTTSGWIVGSEQMTTIGSGVNYTVDPGLVSSSLTWENVTTVDFGLDARFFRDKLGLTFDWYNRKVTDMHSAGLTVPSTLGTAVPLRNYGEMQTRGWELQVDYNTSFDNGLNLNVTAMLSDFTEKITKFGANTSKLLTQNYEGKTLGEIWGYETERFFTGDDFQKDASGNFILNNGKYVLNPGVATQNYWEAGWFFYGPGDVKYRDLDGNDTINFGANTLASHGDMRIIGNSTPRYQYGFRLGADYKGFDINLFVQGVGSRQLWANGPVFIPGYRPGEAWYEHQLDYWTPENTNAFYPRPTDYGGGNPTRNFLPQTKYLLNMAYTRLKNLNIGYSLPQSIIGRARLTRARIYFSGENLLTISNTGKVPLDPEIDYTTSGLNDPNTFGRVYPYRKMYSFGIQVTL